MNKKPSLKIVLSLAVFMLLLSSGMMYSARAKEAIDCPWVYPTTEASPTTTEYYKVLLGSGSSQINLVLWSHRHDFVLGKFVIAIKTGLAQVTIDSMNLAFDIQDLSGTTKPGNFPPGSIFPCPWKQYKVGVNLTDRLDPNGWQGVGDPSGLKVTINITVTGDPVVVKLYFLAWGWYHQQNGCLHYTDTPYSHITETIPPPSQKVPEVPLGPVMATVSMVAAFGAYIGLRKRKPQPTS